MHNYQIKVQWTGNPGKGTANYGSYDRSHTIQAGNKAEIHGSSDPAFRGDPEAYNPEELFVAALSACHMLWYLHLCAEAGVIVTAYEDHATGIMEEAADGGGKFTEVILFPVVTVADGSMVGKAKMLHSKANQKCFIANSVKIPVLHNPVCRILDDRDP
jgi:organic hydroperoxide reductase OsmC/OhrA